MKVTVAAIGSKLPKWADAACAEYAKRIPKHFKFSVRPLTASKGSSGETARREEAARLLGACGSGAIVVALDENGAGWTSEALAGRVSEWQQSGRDVALLIGGASGLHPSVIEASDHQWSLGTGTYPHALARIMVIEQFYRASTILSGHPYHRP